MVDLGELVRIGPYRITGGAWVPLDDEGFPTTGLMWRRTYMVTKDGAKHPMRARFTNQQDAVNHAVFHVIQEATDNRP